MKQYRFRVDTPWGKAGEKTPWVMEYIRREEQLGDQGTVDPSHFPHLFEEVPDPVERVGKWVDSRLSGAAFLVDDPTRTNIDLVKHILKRVYVDFLAAGLDPDKLEGVK